MHGECFFEQGLFSCQCPAAKWAVSKEHGMNYTRQ